MLFERCEIVIIQVRHPSNTVPNNYISESTILFIHPLQRAHCLLAPVMDQHYPRCWRYIYYLSLPLCCSVAIQGGAQTRLEAPNRQSAKLSQFYRSRVRLDDAERRGKGHRDINLFKRLGNSCSQRSRSFPDPSFLPFIFAPFSREGRKSASYWLLFKLNLVKAPCKLGPKCLDCVLNKIHEIEPLISVNLKVLSLQMGWEIIQRKVRAAGRVSSLSRTKLNIKSLF